MSDRPVEPPPQQPDIAPIDPPPPVPGRPVELPPPADTPPVVEPPPTKSAAWLELAEATGRTAYDASYLWGARSLGGELVKLDQKRAAASA